MESIANLVYGIPLNVRRGDPEYSTELEELIENGEPGFLSLYSGHGPKPRAFGVEMRSFNDCMVYAEFKPEYLTPSTAQKSFFDSSWAEIPEEIKKEMIEKFGEPRVFLLWSTS